MRDNKLAQIGLSTIIIVVALYFAVLKLYGHKTEKMREAMRPHSVASFYPGQKNINKWSEYPWDAIPQNHAANQPCEWRTRNYPEQRNDRYTNPDRRVRVLYCGQQLVCDYAIIFDPTITSIVDGTWRAPHGIAVTAAVNGHATAQNYGLPGVSYRFITMFRIDNRLRTVSLNVNSYSGNPFAIKDVFYPTSQIAQAYLDERNRLAELADKADPEFAARRKTIIAGQGYTPPEFKKRTASWPSKVVEQKHVTALWRAANDLDYIDKFYTGEVELSESGRVWLEVENQEVVLALLAAGEVWQAVRHQAFNRFHHTMMNPTVCTGSEFAPLEKTSFY